jgi:hypothetical protein
MTTSMSQEVTSVDPLVAVAWYLLLQIGWWMNQSGLSRSAVELLVAISWPGIPKARRQHPLYLLD